MKSATELRATMGILIVAAIAAAAAMATPPAQSQPASASQPQKTDWLHKAKWGVMIHAGSTLPPGTWGQAMDGFDAATLARQIHEVGAGVSHDHVDPCRVSHRAQRGL
jgi:hypothetical protein